MDNQLVLLIIILGVINFSLRFFPAAILKKVTMPDIATDWLSFVPVATISALVLPMIVGWQGKTIVLSMNNPNLIAAIPSIIVAAKTKSLAFTLATGMFVMAMIQW